MSSQETVKDQEPVFPQGRSAMPVTWGSENGLRYLEAAATAFRTNAAYSLADRPQAQGLLVLANQIETIWKDARSLVEEIKRNRP